MKCPKCGDTKVQLTAERSKHGCLWFILFGAFWLMWVGIKWTIGLMIFMCWDWWMAIVKASQKKGYIWKSKQWFSGVKRKYYCHNCGYNFKG